MISRNKIVIILALILVVLSVQLVAAQGDGDLRELEGTLTIALQGAVPVPGAPLTSQQLAWQTVLDRYQELQPNVEIVVEDVPIDMAGEQWCTANQAAGNFPDIANIENCSRGNPSLPEIEAGQAIATNFYDFQDEVNPYTGQTWSADWANNDLRMQRCQQQSLKSDWWGCITDRISHDGVWVNTAILEEYGYDGMPETYTELYELSNQINADGRYVAWDSPPTAVNGYARTVYSAVTLDRFLAAGGDPSDIATSWGILFGAPANRTLVCEGMWSPEYPSVTEALLQIQRYVDAQMPGGGAAYFDPARDITGQFFLAGRAAFRHEGTGFWANIQQAQADGVLGVDIDDLAVAAFPVFTEDELIDSSIEIGFEGQPALWGGGFGDMFAPIPSARASGEDENVDLLVRDFLQFLTSAEGQERVLIEGAIPVNPEALEQANPALLPWLNLKPEIFQGFQQPPGSYSNFTFYAFDTERNIHAWLAGQLDQETAWERAEANARVRAAEVLSDSLETLGLDEMPEACAPYVTT